MTVKGRKAVPSSARRGAAQAIQRKSEAKYVYSFGEVKLAERVAGSWDGVRGLLGGKGANLGEMTNCAGAAGLS
jgi:pyruvate,orthophosphate dikinase